MQRLPPYHRSRTRSTRRRGGEEARAQKEGTREAPSGAAPASAPAPSAPAARQDAKARRIQRWWRLRRWRASFYPPGKSWLESLHELRVSGAFARVAPEPPAPPACIAASATVPPATGAVAHPTASCNGAESKATRRAACQKAARAKRAARAPTYHPLPPILVFPTLEKLLLFTFSPGLVAAATAVIGAQAGGLHELEGWSLSLSVVVLLVIGGFFITEFFTLRRFLKLHHDECWHGAEKPTSNVEVSTAGPCAMRAMRAWCCEPGWKERLWAPSGELVPTPARSFELAPPLGGRPPRSIPAPPAIHPLAPPALHPRSPHPPHTPTREPLSCCVSCVVWPSIVAGRRPCPRDDRQAAADAAALARARRL